MEMQERFQTMPDSIINRIDEISSRVANLEQFVTSGCNKLRNEISTKVDVVIDKISDVEDELATLKMDIGGVIRHGRHEQSEIPCRFYAAGSWSKGVRCPFLHDVAGKTKGKSKGKGKRIPAGVANPNALSPKPNDEELEHIVKLGDGLQSV